MADCKYKVSNEREHTMSVTLNAGLIAPVGYARTYTNYQATACSKHAAYTLFCGSCDYVPVAHRVALEGDVIALILDREDGSVVEWLTPDSGAEFAANVAHDGVVVVREDVWDDANAYPVAVAAMHEATLYADCFSTPASALPESE